MNKKLLISSFLCSLCLAVTAQVNAKSTVDAQTQKYQQVCKSKKQGDMVSFAYKGVVYNGTCEPNESGKLAFQPPTPWSPRTRSGRTLARCKTGWKTPFPT